MEYEIDFLKSLTLTILIESVVLIIAVRVLFSEKYFSLWILALTGIIASFTTLPYLWFVLPLFIKSKIYYILVSELSAIIIETFIISGFLRINIKHAIVMSAICNMISYSAGLVIHLP
jgi:hypothetical protein